jgi:hypothetical protein
MGKGETLKLRDKATEKKYASIEDQEEKKISVWELRVLLIPCKYASEKQTRTNCTEYRFLA